MNINYGRLAPSVEGSTGPRAKCDQVIFEALCKACEMIVNSRGEPQAQHATNMSSRFNLTLPEHASVRQILQKWRRALHLPLRLDVYYEHSSTDATAPPQRELLERWCLVYAPPSSSEWIQYQQQQQRLGNNNNATNPASITLDPIVQLRQVCKKIVVWLRTLYCMARMLPATAFLHYKTSNVGFSLYAISEGSNDDVQLQQQGFLCHPSTGHMQPSHVVGTPFGVLTWKVLTAEASIIHRLSGRTRRQAWDFLPSATNRAVSRAIPIQRPHETRHNHNVTEDVEDEQDYYHYVHPEPGIPQQEMPTHRTQGRTDQNDVPRSAPAHMQASPWQQQQQIPSVGDSTSAAKHQLPHHHHHHHSTGIPPNTYQQPSRFRERLSKPEFQRRHTSIGNEGISFVEDTDRQSEVPPPPSSGEAKRVLSGLSLAMMTVEDNNKDEESDTQSVPQNINEAAATSNSKGKRRAALHQAPPHRRPSMDDTSATPTKATTYFPAQHFQQQTSHQQPPLHRDVSQEYGYAYNNHIPWQKIHPSQNHPSLQQRGEVDDSPSRTAMVVLGNTPPPMLLNPGSYTGHTSPSFGKHLLPPRSGSSGAPLTPPFPNRPSGFAVNLEPSPTMAPALANARSMSPLQPRLEIEHPGTSSDHVGPQPLTSLDLLHQSPFSWNPNTHGSMLSSLTMPDSTMMDLKRSLLLTHQRPTEILGLGGSVGVDWADEMPFVVEDAAPVAGASETAGQTQHDFSSLTASSAVASLAQKCANTQRLQLFESRTAEDRNDGLTQQLADFRAFANASLMEGATPSSSSSAVTSATPTTLRT